MMKGSIGYNEYEYCAQNKRTKIEYQLSGTQRQTHLHALPIMEKISPRCCSSLKDLQLPLVFLQFFTNCLVPEAKVRQFLVFRLLHVLTLLPLTQSQAVHLHLQLSLTLLAHLQGLPQLQDDCLELSLALRSCILRLLFFFVIFFLEGLHLLLETKVFRLKLPYLLSQCLRRHCLTIASLCDLLPQSCQISSILPGLCLFARAASFRLQFLLELPDPPLQLQDVTVAFLQQLIQPLAQLRHSLRIILFMAFVILAANVVVPPA